MTTRIKHRQDPSINGIHKIFSFWTSIPLSTLVRICHNPSIRNSWRLSHRIFLPGRLFLTLPWPFFGDIFCREVAFRVWREGIFRKSVPPTVFIVIFTHHVAVVHYEGGGVAASVRGAVRHRHAGPAPLSIAAAAARAASWLSPPPRRLVDHYDAPPETASGRRHSRNWGCFHYWKFMAKQF